MRVKTVATLGPASMNPETMRAMVDHGVRIFRLNFSHANAATFAPTVRTIRQLEADAGVPLTIMGDLCGPKTRIGQVLGSPLEVPKGNTVLLGLPDMAGQAPKYFPAEEVTAFAPLDMPELLQGLEEGMTVYLSDGMLQFRIVQTLVRDKLYAMQAINDGLLTSNKGIAFPGKHHAMPAMTPKDYQDLREGLELDIDAVALSFVQSHKDVVLLRDEMQRLGKKAAIVAKLERKNAVDDLEAILQVADVVMVARGDLGLECPMAELPVIQKRIIRAARHAQKASIVATQMLLSMVQNPIPTRAESTDVANAILDGADCVMLSEETAVGKHPVRVVSYIEEIARSAEEYYLERIQGPFAPKKEKNPAKYLAYCATLMAENADSKAIVCHSSSGATARNLSSRRPAHPIYALCSDELTMRTLNFMWGIKPRAVDTSLPRHMARVEKFVRECPDFAPGENAILTSGQPTPGQAHMHTNSLKIYYK